MVKFNIKFIFAEPALVAKSCVTLGISPWDDETDLDKMEEIVRSVQMDGKNKEFN